MLSLLSLEKLIGGGWRRKICPYTPTGSRSLACQIMHVYAGPESFVQIPPGSGRKKTVLALPKKKSKQTIIHKDGGRAGVCISLPPHFAPAEPSLMNVAKGFTNSLV